MLTAHILPMPTLDAERYVSLFLTNPLLLAAHPDEMQATAAHWASGDYDAIGTAALAMDLYKKRKHLLLRSAAEPRDNEAQQELFSLAAHPLLKVEHTRLREKIMEARPSEYSWLRGILEAAIIKLAGERTAQVLESQAEPTPAPRRLDVALAAARGLVVTASQLAA